MLTFVSMTMLSGAEFRPFGGMTMLFGVPPDMESCHSELQKKVIPTAKKVIPTAKKVIPTQVGIC